MPVSSGVASGEDRRQYRRLAHRRVGLAGVVRHQEHVVLDLNVRSGQRSAGVGIDVDVDEAADLPAGSSIEITLEVDRGGRLAARALVPALDQVFEHVEHLLVPEAHPEVLEATARAMRDRVDAVRAEAFRRGSARAVDRLGEVERQLAEVARDAAAAAGGDADAGQKARRTLLEIDALLEQIDMERKWPELDQEARPRRGFLPL